MSGRLRTSRAGLELIKSFEGFRDGAIRLPDGRWTIGYGHVRSAREGLIISQKDAEDLLVHDLGVIEAAIGSLVFTPLNQNQFDALVSLVFNISPGQFRDSEIIAYLNAGDFLSAANAFDAWRKARIHGRVMVVDALVRRRAAEKAMFLEHPDGRPSAPTPLVSPTRDTDGDARPADTTGKHRAAARQAEPQSDEPVSPPPPPPPSGGREPPIDIAEAVRRLAERTNQILADNGGPVPPQFRDEPREDEAVEVEAEAVEIEVEFVEVEAEPIDDIGDDGPAGDREASVHTEHVEEPIASPPPPPRSASQIDEARRAVAERVAKILERTERAIAEQSPEPEPKVEARPEPKSEPVKSRPAAMPKPEKIFGDIPEDLPDFDKPAEPRIKPQTNGRKFIDDTEIVDPGRDPAEMFAEAERKAKIVNGRSKNLGLINGRWAALWPWAFILVLSLVGFGIGLVDTFGDSASASGPVRGAATVLAVFGLMMLMSVYFIVTRASENE